MHHHDVDSTTLALVLACIFLLFAAVKLVEPKYVSWGWLGVFILAVLSYFR